MARKPKAPVVEVTEKDLTAEELYNLAPAIEQVAEVIIESKETLVPVVIPDVAELDTTYIAEEVIQDAPEVIQSQPDVLELNKVEESQVTEPVVASQEELGFAARYKAPVYVVTKQGGLTFFDLPSK